MFGEKADGSSWVGEDEDVLSLANDHDNYEEKIEGDTQLIKENGRGGAAESVEIHNRRFGAAIMMIGVVLLVGYMMFSNKRASSTSSYSKQMKDYLNVKFKETGHSNMYFPQSFHMIDGADLLEVEYVEQEEDLLVQRSHQVSRISTAAEMQMPMKMMAEINAMTRLWMTGIESSRSGSFDGERHVIVSCLIGASAGGKNIVAKAPRKGALSGRKPLGDLSNSIQPTPNQSIKKQNSSMFSFTEKEKLTFDGNKKKTSGRKALSDTSNSRKQQLNEAPKKNLSTKNIDLKTFSMESQVGNLIQDQNVHFKGASAGVKNIVAKAPRKEALSRRKPLGDLSNSIQPTPNWSIKKQNSSMFSFTEKETGASKLTFDGNKRKTSGRKALSDTSNSRKQQPNESPKKNLSTKVIVVAEEDLDAICEEDFPMQQSASSSQVAMDDLLSEDEFPWKHEEFSDYDSPPPCRSSPKSPNHFMMWEEDTVDDFDIINHVVSLTKENCDINSILRIALVEKSLNRLTGNNSEQQMQRVGFGFMMGSGSNGHQSQESLAANAAVSASNKSNSSECEEEVVSLMVKALCVLSLGLQMYLKEVFLLDSVGYLSVNGLDLAWWTSPLRS
ncbi:hypothetical protein LWI29_024944 [Acer saccharum]|uniref:Uncharacterized protein n=1 Tax=Acer saccharum TaxID=4024 RepID=A0AA39VZX6_ACESA|nr:hypothetical protein LWI29_024944 [Acer saccharum]